MSYRRACFALLALAIVLIITFFFSPFFSQNTDRFRSKEEAMWVTYIRTLGGEHAYALFAKRVAHLTEPEKHLAGHAFGAALYRTLGVEGLSVCDEKYAYACFHEFMGYAISELGIDSVIYLNETCIEVLGSRSLACQHAMGHGIQTFFGYEYENLMEALETCKELPYNDPISGCFGGAFMEYNMRTMLGREGVVLPVTRDPGELCRTVRPEFQRGCFYWAPHWWHVVLFESTANEETFRALGVICDETAPNDELLEVCYRGIGLITPQAALHEPEKTHALCLASSERSSRALACLSNAANIISLALGVETAERVCAGLETSMHAYCLSYAGNTANVRHALPLPSPL